MPKEMKRRRIDGKPPRMVRRRSGGGGSVIVDEPTEDITVVTTFSGGGPPGTVATFEGILRSGDLFIVAHASETGAGTVTISPSAGWWAWSTSAVNRGSVTTFKVAYDQDGAAEFTVTTANEETAFYGWVLRGVQTGFTTPLLVSAHDEALVSYTGSGPTPCESEITRTDWYGQAVVVPPAAGSFAVYSATGRKGPCEDVAAVVALGGSPVTTGFIGGVTSYEFGTLSGGGGTMTADVTSGNHGIWAGVTIFSVAPLAL